MNNLVFSGGNNKHDSFMQIFLSWHDKWDPVTLSPCHPVTTARKVIKLRTEQTTPRYEINWKRTLGWLIRGDHSD